MHKLKETIMHVVFLIAALVSIAAVALICVFLFVNGIPAIKEIGFGDFTLGEVWKPTNGYYGILPFILGSIYVTAGALIIGVPIGLLTAIYLAKFCPVRLYKVIKPFINLMAGIPSVVYGFFGMCVLVPMVRSIFGVNGNTMLTASVLLGMMILPTIISVSETSIRAVPDKYYHLEQHMSEACSRLLFLRQSQELWQRLSLVLAVQLERLWRSSWSLEIRSICLTEY